MFLLPGASATLVLRITGIGILPEDLTRVFEWLHRRNGRLDSGPPRRAEPLQRYAHVGHASGSNRGGVGTRAMLYLARDTMEIE